MALRGPEQTGGSPSPQAVASARELGRGWGPGHPGLWPALRSFQLAQVHREHIPSLRPHLLVRPYLFGVLLASSIFVFAAPSTTADQMLIAWDGSSLKTCMMDIAQMPSSFLRESSGHRSLIFQLFRLSAGKTAIFVPGREHWGGGCGKDVDFSSRTPCSGSLPKQG